MTTPQLRFQPRSLQFQAALAVDLKEALLEPNLPDANKEYIVQVKILTDKRFEPITNLLHNRGRHISKELSKDWIEWLKFKKCNFHYIMSDAGQEWDIFQERRLRMKSFSSYRPRTFAHAAAMGNHPDIIRELSEIDSHLIFRILTMPEKRKTENGYSLTDLELTALHNAALAGDTDAVIALVESGIDVNIPDSGGRTALHYASAIGNLDMINALLKRGADVNLRDSLKEDTALHCAVNNGDEASVRALLESHADVNARNKFGNVPLFYAVHKNQAIVTALIENKAENIRNREGYSPLYESILGLDWPVARILYKNNARLTREEKLALIPMSFVCMPGMTLFKMGSSVANLVEKILSTA